MKDDYQIFDYAFAFFMVCCGVAMLALSWKMVVGA